MNRDILIFKDGRPILKKGTDIFGQEILTVAAQIGMNWQCEICNLEIPDVMHYCLCGAAKSHVSSNGCTLNTIQEVNWNRLTQFLPLLPRCLLQIIWEYEPVCADVATGKVCQICNQTIVSSREEQLRQSWRLNATDCSRCGWQLFLASQKKELQRRRASRKQRINEWRELVSKCSRTAF